MNRFVLTKMVSRLFLVQVWPLLLDPNRLQFVNPAYLNLLRMYWNSLPQSTRSKAILNFEMIPTGVRLLKTLRALLCYTARTGCSAARSQENYHAISGCIMLHANSPRLKSAPLLRGHNIDVRNPTALPRSLKVST